MELRCLISSKTKEKNHAKLSYCFIDKSTQMNGLNKDFDETAKVKKILIQKLHRVGNFRDFKVLPKNKTVLKELFPRQPFGNLHLKVKGRSLTPVKSKRSKSLNRNHTKELNKIWD